MKIKGANLCFVKTKTAKISLDLILAQNDPAACVTGASQRSRRPKWSSAISKGTDLFLSGVFFVFLYIYITVTVMPSVAWGLHRTPPPSTGVCLHRVPSKPTNTVQTYRHEKINSDGRWFTDWNVASGKDQRKEVIQNPSPETQRTQRSAKRANTNIWQQSAGDLVKEQ